MTTRFFFALTVLLVAGAQIIACSATPVDNESEADSSAPGGATSGETLGDPTEDSSQATSNGSVESSSSGGSQDAGSGDPVDLNVCERLIGCATAAVIPVTPLQMLYGEDGSCWRQYGPMDCWIDCAAQLEALSLMNPLIEECRQCDDDADCAVFRETPFCASSGSCCAEPQGCSLCGNGLVNAGEECDTNDFADATCETFGFEYGGLTCDPMTCTIDTSECVGCGNGQIDSGEQCDGANLMGFDCFVLGYSGGTLFCAEDCQSFDTRSCIG